MVTSLLSEADANEIEAAVARVEAVSSAELVVAVVPRSEAHLVGRGAWAVAWALAAGFAFLHFEPWQEPAWALVVELLVGALTFWLSGLPALHRLLIARSAAEAAAQARAFQLFAERGLYRTRGRTALLIFVSELEHRVVMLGDRAIDRELGQSGWDAHVAQLTSRIRRGEARAGLLALIEQLEPLLVRVAPPVEQDENELPNAVLRG